MLGDHSLYRDLHPQNCSSIGLPDLFQLLDHGDLFLFDHMDYQLRSQYLE